MVQERNTRIRYSQIASVRPDDLDATNAIGSGMDDYVPVYDSSTGKFVWIYIGHLDTLEYNIMLNAFRISINGSLSVQNMLDGVTDEFEDETGVDTGSSTNEEYNSSDDYYTPTDFIRSNADIFDFSFPDLIDWTDSDGGTGESSQVTFDNQSCLKLDTGATAGGGNHAYRQKDVGTFSSTRNVYSFKIYCNAIGTLSDGDYFAWAFDDGVTYFSGVLASDGLFINDGVTHNEVGTDLVVQNIWQEWTFDVDTVAQTVDVYLDGILKASGVDCSRNTLVSNGTIRFIQYGNTTSNRISYIDWVKVGSNYINLPEDMTLISNNTEAESQPDEGRLVLFEEDVDAVTLNTDLKAYVSRDNGANWIQVTLSDEGDYDTSKRILVGTADISGQAADKTMKWKVETLNNKDLKLHGIGMLWR